LERALKAFDGSVIFVSHDRYFLNQVADHLLVVEPARFRIVEGNYDTYQHLVRQGLAGPAQATPGKRSSPSKPAAPPAERNASPGKRKRKFPYRKVPDIEAEIAEREARIAELHLALGSPEVLRDGQRVRQVKSELEEHQARLPQ